MSKETKSPEMANFCDAVALSLLGRSRSLAKTGKCCVACGKSAAQFRDSASQREYNISGLCQDCQDSIFGRPSGSE